MSMIDLTVYPEDVLPQIMKSVLILSRKWRKEKKMDGLKIDYETADRIAALSLKDIKESIQRDMKEHDQFGGFMHPQDIVNNLQLIKAIDLLLSYYGIEV